MRSINITKELPRDALPADMAAAFAAALAAALEGFLIKLLDKQYIPLPMYIEYVLLALASYLAVALLLHRFWAGLLRRVLPSWILTAFFGSILFVFIRLTPGIIGGWYDPLRLQSSLFDYISTEISAAKSVVVLLSFITIPIAGLAYLLTYFVLRRYEKRNCMP